MFKEINNYIKTFVQGPYFTLFSSFMFIVESLIFAGVKNIF